jgi:hypothetical protein
VTTPLLLPLLRFAFLAGLLWFVARVVGAALADLDVRKGPAQIRRAVLVTQSPDGMRGREFLVSSEAVIGRDAGCAIVLSDDYASAQHARVFERDGRIWVEDLHSTNGTLLNGQRLRRVAPLEAGDQLKIGATVLAFRVERE